MRKSVLAGCLLLFLAVSAHAGQMKEFEFMDGLYKFQAPKDWVVEADEDGIGVVLKPRADSLSTITFTAPNPHFQGELKGYLGAYLLAMFNVIGNGEIAQFGEDKIGGHDAVTAVFSLALGDEQAAGF
ncbi:MAG: hypothetical protein LBV15_04665, partial [Planctomycetota bacterium]|nr:hypothetical protein [Planctomycetota bacterium]